MHDYLFKYLNKNFEPFDVLKAITFYKDGKPINMNNLQIEFQIDK